MIILMLLKPGLHHFRQSCQTPHPSPPQARPTGKIITLNWIELNFWIELFNVVHVSPPQARPGGKIITLNVVHVMCFWEAHNIFSKVYECNIGSLLIIHASLMQNVFGPTLICIVFYAFVCWQRGNLCQNKWKRCHVTSDEFNRHRTKHFPILLLLTLSPLQSRHYSLYCSLRFSMSGWHFLTHYRLHKLFGLKMKLIHHYTLNCARLM